MGFRLRRLLELPDPTGASCLRLGSVEATGLLEGGVLRLGDAIAIRVLIVVVARLVSRKEGSAAQADYFR